MAPYPLPHVMPRGRTSTRIRPQWALVIAARRASLGITQEEVAARTGDVLNQKNVSDFEGGRVHLADTTVPRAAALARALEWSLFELQEATGVDLGLTRHADSTLRPVAMSGVPTYPLTAALHDAPPLPTTVMLSPRTDAQPHPPQLRAYVMPSDEMQVAGQRSIHPGDYVVTDLGDHRLVHNALYVVTRNGTAYVRRFKDTEMGSGFYADNVSYDPIPATGTHIVGRVYRLSSADRAPTLN